MVSVCVGQADVSPIELGRRREVDAGRRRRTFAARDRYQSGVGAPLAVLAEQATEMGIVRSLLDDVIHGGGALVVSGEQGVGKSSLLDAAETEASAMGMRVVRVNGAEFEADIGLAGLHQLLVPLSAEISELPNHSRRAINATMKPDVDTRRERLVVLNAVFDLFQRAAVPAPMLLIVDDAQWFDQASTEVLAFIARRLAGSRVGLLAAMRKGSRSLLVRVGLPELSLRPLRTVPVDDRSLGLAGELGCASQMSMDDRQVDLELRAEPRKAPTCCIGTVK